MHCFQQAGRVISNRYIAIALTLLSSPPVLAQSIVVEPQTPQQPKPPASVTQDPLDLIAVGIQINQRTVLASVFVKGKEDGSAAVDFSRWLIPFDAVVQALRLTVTPQGDGHLEIRSPFRITRLAPAQLLPDADLGQVITMDTLQELLGIEITFDVFEYALQIHVPELKRSAATRTTAAPIMIDGLVKTTPPTFSLGGIDQSLRLSGNPAEPTPVTGELRLAGNLLGGNWLVTLDQPEVRSLDRWSFVNAQYFHFSPHQDWILGSQNPFWRNPHVQDYWGLTAVHRHGFTTPDHAGIGLDVRERLQASQLQRSVSGRAAPGTLVRLASRFDNEVIDEVLVDSSGFFQFRNIPVGTEVGAAYELQLYPEGQLTVDPIIREVTLSSVPGQVPAGQAAWLLSLGTNRQRTEQDILGSFRGLQGGGALRWGLTSDTTLGLTVAYDQTLFTEANLFYSSGEIPLDVSLSYIHSPEWNILTDIRFEPSDDFYVFLVGDRTSQRLNLDWQLSDQVRLRSRYTRIGEGSGISSLFTEGIVRLGRRQTFAELTLGYDTQTQWQGQLRSRLGRWSLTHRINNTSLSSALGYQLTTGFRQARQSLQFNYESRQSNNFLTRLSWQYRSRTRGSDGRSLWDTELGYALGARGRGPFLAFSTGIVPGLRLQARYQGVSLFSDEARLSLEITSSYNAHTKTLSGNRLVDSLLTAGSLILKPFFDHNNNGRQDPGEPSYVDDVNLLMLNHQPLQFSRPQTRSHAWFLELEPGTYRIDVDPAGFPLNWQTATDAYAVEVTAGSATTLSIPLQPGYTLTGVVTDKAGQPIGGARVEAIAPDATPIISITNGAGVYYLERLQGQEYQLQVNGQSTEPGRISLQQSDEFFQTLNLRLIPGG